MKTIASNRFAWRALLCATALAYASTAHANAVTDQNAGTWIDLYNDESDIAPGTATIGGNPGRANVRHDPFAQLVTLNATTGAGSWFTSEIAPASFDAWKSLYIDYTASAANQVQVEVWNATNGNASATRVLGPVSPGASDDPSYSGKISLASIASSVKRIRVRVLLAPGTIAPTVSALKATFNPLAVLQGSLEAPATRATGESIQVRMPVSVSFVNATSYVAYLSVVGSANDRYGQNPQLTFESATLNGQYTATGLTVNGVAVPARSVYWSLATQQAGQTFAYNASFRSPNGLVRGISFDFQGKVFASNAASTTTPTQTTRLEAVPRTTLSKYASGTFVIGGEHFARNTAGLTNAQRTITVSVAPTNWWNQPIPNGAQSYFVPVVWDSFQDFLDKGAAAYADITALNGGIKTASAVTIRGITVPANSVYWDLATMPAGQRLDLGYQVVISTGVAPGTTINACNIPQATLATPQESVTGVNACSGTECARRTACLPIKIGVNESPGWALGKGDQVSGSYAIRTGYDDNPNSFVTWGQPVDFKMAVGNNALAHLSNVVVYDYVKPNWTLVTASIPAPGQVYYWIGAVPSDGSIPVLYTAIAPNGVPTRDPQWVTARPGTVNWIAYEIPSLRSGYCSGPNGANGITNCLGTEPTSVQMDLTIVPAPASNVCTTEYVDNGLETGATNAQTRGATAHVYTHTNLSNVITNVLGTPFTQSDWERVEVRPLKPDLTTSFGGGQGNVLPGATSTQSFTIQNRNKLNNPVDTARNVVATFTIPNVTANGLSTRLSVVGIESSGGSVSYTYDGQGIATAVVSWASILPNSAKAVTLSYQLPTGIKNQSSFTTNVAIRADDDCGIPTGSASAASTIASEPVLSVDKDLDYRVVASNTPVTYTLTYQNLGTAPAEKTWVLDRIDDATRIVGAKVEVGEVWFSSHLPPYSVTNPTTQGLPSALIPAFQFTDAVVRAHFQPGNVNNTDGDGFIIPPVGTKWVAFLVDNPSVDGMPVSPSIFPTGLAQEAYVKVEVANADALGQLVVNEAAIDADTLEQSIGPRVSFIVSNDPGLELAKMCNEVVALGETVTYDIHFRNDTTNPDNVVVVEDVLPFGFVYDTITTSVDADDFDDSEVDANDRQHLVWIFSEIEADTDVVTITVTGTFPQGSCVCVDDVCTGICSGTTVHNEVVATATNTVSTRTFFDDCPTRIQNTELSVTKLVSNPQPVSNSEITYTIAVTNHNLRAAEDVVITDLLPTASVPPSVDDPLTYVQDSLQVLTPGWSANIDGAMNIRLTKSGFDEGYFPGALTPTTVRLSFRAHIKTDVKAGKTLTNTVTVETSTGEDCAGDATACPDTPNTASVDVKTPWPDPYVTISATPVVKPGEIATWTVNYGNQSPETAEGTVVYFTMPDGPNSSPANETDFTFTTVSVPPNVKTYYSSAKLDARVNFDPTNPTANGWSETPSGIVNHIAFWVHHCGAGGSPCQGVIAPVEGPFTATIKAEARQPQDQALPGIGGTFTGCAEILMHTPGLVDNDYTNNGTNPKRCANVVTPGVGIEVEATCVPNGSFPGLTPGSTTTFAFAFRNNGTTPDYGVHFTIALDPNLDYVGDTAGIVLLQDASGAEVTPIGADGFRLPAAPSWTRVGNVFTLGPIDAAQSYALAPGDTGIITVSARVKPEVLDGHDLVNHVSAEVEGRDGIDEDELDLDDNSDSCGNTVYRADVIIDKTMVNGTFGWKTYADGGDDLNVTLEYNNIGHYEAGEVIMTDTLPEGLYFKDGTLRGVPEGAVVEYADANGDWSYQPQDDVDPNVRAIRVRYLDGATMTAPANTFFSQTSADDFDHIGTFKSTTVDYSRDAVIPQSVEDGTFSTVVPKTYTNQDTNLGVMFRQDQAVVMQTAYARQQFEGPVVIDEIAFRWWDAPGTKPFSTFKVELAYLNPASRSGASGDFTLSEVFDTNMGASRKVVRDAAEITLVSTGAYAPNGGRAFEYAIPFDQPFTYDPALGDLVVLVRCQLARGTFTVEQLGSGEEEPAAIRSIYAVGQLDATAGDANARYDLVTRFKGVSGASPSYTSPVFPNVDEGNVVEWGQLVVTPEFGDENATDTMSIDVLDENGTVIANYELDDGNATYSFDLNDIEGFDVATYQSLSLRANFGLSEVADVCMEDIVPTDTSFWGLPTGLNESDRVIGFQRSRTAPQSPNVTAFTWQDDDANVTDLHAVLPRTGPVTLGTHVAVDPSTQGNSAGWLQDQAKTYQLGYHANYFGSSPSGARQITAIAFYNGSGNPGVRSATRTQVTLAYANPALRNAQTGLWPANEASIPRSFANNIVSGTEVVVFDGAHSFDQVSNGFAPPINFTTPFRYNPNQGDLIVTVRTTGYSPFESSMQTNKPLNPESGFVLWGSGFNATDAGQNEDEAGSATTRFSYVVQPDASAVWDTSMATDINEAGTIVGWGKPNQSQLAHIPNSCDIAQTLSDVCNRPDSGCGGSDFGDGTPISLTQPTRIQWTVDANRITTGKVRLDRLQLRHSTFDAAGTRTLHGLEVRIGYAATTTMGASFESNRGQQQTIYNGDYTYETTSAPFVEDMSFPIAQPFEFDASVGLPLLIEISFTRVTGSPFVVQWNSMTPNDGAIRTLSSINDAAPTTNYRTTEARLSRASGSQAEASIVWKQVGDAWESACLAPPASLSDDEALEPPSLPRTSNVYINDNGLIAAASNVLHAAAPNQGSTAKFYGTPTIWCEQSVSSLSYAARTMIDDNGSPLPLSTITGLNNRNEVIGISSIFDGEFNYNRAYVWLAQYSMILINDVGSQDLGSSCPQWFQPFDLTSALANTLGYYEAMEVVPLGIDDDGVIVGQFRYSDYAWRVVVWNPIYFNGQVVAYNATIPMRNETLNTRVSAGLGSNGAVAHPLATTEVIAGGQFPFVNVLVDHGFGDAYRFDVDANSTTPIGSGLGDYDIVTGGSGTTALGLADGNTLTTWANFGEGAIALGELNGSLPVPLYANAGRLVIGAAVPVDTIGNDGGNLTTARVFKWRECTVTGGDTPRLLDWKVTYLTDKSPSWGFGVEVADLCMTSVTNGSDISTATPEITTSNNTSSASMSVNTANLGVTLELESNVVSPDDWIYGAVAITNDGPGSARDVSFWMEPPVGCKFSYAYIQMASQVSYDDYDYDDDYIEAYFDDIPFEDGDPFAWVYFECDVYTEEADFSMAINAELESPTIDCDAGNDAAASTVVIGDYPNLWVSLEGPPSGLVNVPVPYELDLGNNGNDDGNGTIVVTLPPGTYFEIDCSRVEVEPTSFEGIDCIPNLLMEVIQPTATEPGTVTFVPAIEPWNEEPAATFDPGESYDVPFTLTWLDCGASNTTAEIHASVVPDGADANFADNTANTETFVVAPSGELALTVVPSDTRAEVGSELFYTFYFANNGSVAAVGTELELRLPNGLAIESVIPKHENANGFYAVGRGSAVDDDGNFVKSLLPTDSGAITVRVRVTGPVSGTGSVTLHTLSGACEASAPITGPTIAPPENPGLHVLVSSSTGSACGQDAGIVDWTVTVTNPGTAIASATPISIDIPAGLTYVPGSIKGQGGIDLRAPNLLWLANIPAQGALSFTFSTTVQRTELGVVSLPASVGAVQGSGSLAIDCGERVVVNKAWDLVCGLAGDTFTITATVTNKTSSPISGTLWDTFQTGVTGAFEGQTASFVVNQLLPGATFTTSYDIVVGAPLGFGDPLFDRVVFDSTTTIQAVSNQVGGAIISCATPGQCQSNTCQPLLGCVTVTDGPFPDVPERCDNQLDDNCNGQVNEGFDDLGQACDGDDSDKCELGAWTCAGTTLTCTETEHVTEVCDGRDNDCDDFVDETWTRNGEGAVGPFFIGDDCDSNTTDADLCSNDVYRCSPDDDTTIACIQLVAPQTETCNGQDDNCNGRTDENWVVTTNPEAASNPALNCDGNDSDACDDGKFVCNPLDPTTTVCLETGTPKVEICDGLDNDCDDQIDETFPTLNQPCDSNLQDGDLCLNDIVACNPQDRTRTMCQQVVAAQAELCNNFDDNCNGQVDETFKGGFWKLGEACDGADGDDCNEGVFVCNASQDGTTCNDDTTTNSELCNGLDDNCNGQTDEDWKVGNTVGFTGINGRFLGQTCDGTNDADLCLNGNIECSLDFTTVYCHEGPVGFAEVCDPAGTGDEDCDGQINEGFDIGVACVTDDLGVCKTAGTFACSADDNTTAECVATTPVTPGTETCNGLDDDCDGVTDDNDPNGPGVASSVCLPIETDILTGPPAITSATTATFTYVNPLANPTASHTTFQCSLDGGAWTTCNHVGATPSLTYPNLPVGSHTLLVRATRGDGAVDPTPDVWTWVIDTTLPDTTIVSAPTNPSQNPNGTIVFGSPTPNPDFYSCVLDPAGGVCPATGAAAYSVCATPYPVTNLADGAHTICVYVTNTAGTPDPVPASYTWVIDTVPPETEIVATIPPKVTAETTVVFNYVDPTAPATNTFECSLDGAAWTDCDGKTNTYTDLPEGEHVFDVRTVDPNGNVDPTPASYTFVVDITAPCPTIAVRPANPAQSHAAVFGFTAAEPNVTFFCALDPVIPAGAGEPALSAYSECPASVSYSNLADGNHTLWVYAVDAVDNLGTCRASYTWLIDTRYPETEITDGPTPLTGSGEEVTFSYSDPTNDDTITFECSLDGATYTRCDGTTPGEGGTIDYADLPVGQHTITVRTCDFTKAPPVQCDPTPASWTWEVTVSPCPNDKTAPGMTCAAALTLECINGGAEVDFGDLQPVSTDACEPLATTTSASSEVVLGQNPIVFSSTDGNGNLSSCVTMVTVSDTAAPNVVCPADIEAPTDAGVCNASLDIGAATATDACQGTAGILFVNDAPTAFQPGETTVTHRAIDAAGNESLCTQTIVVADEEDLVLTCSDSISVDAAADECGWTGTQTALATDNCSDEITVEVTGSYPVGDSPILFTAADKAGNSDQCTTILTVRDITPPVVTCGTPVGTLPVIITATATDACIATVTIENLVCTKLVDGESVVVPAADCPATIDGASIEIDSRLTDGTLTVTYDARAVDPSNNVTLVNCTESYDPDRDADGVIDAEDSCVDIANADQSDIDEDGVGDLCDVCPAVADEDQADRDGDGIGDACSDKDGDTVLDIEDNCETDANTDQRDADGDGDGDVCDPTPYEGLTAEGDGGCTGGGAGALLGLLGLALVIGRRR